MTCLSSKGKRCTVVAEQWKEAVSSVIYPRSEEYVLKYQSIVDTISRSHPLTKDQEEQYLEWGVKTVKRWTDEIVGSQQRALYHNAAGLLIAMAETLAGRGPQWNGVELIEHYRNKYPRHTAFKKELNQAMQRSGVFR